MKTLMLALAAVVPMAHAVTTTVSSSLGHTVFIDNGNVYAMGQDTYSEVIPVNGSVVSSISSVGYRTPQYTKVQNAKSVATQYGRSAVLKNDGTLVVWGVKDSKAGYVIEVAQNVTDIAVTASTVYFISNGSLYSWVNGTPVKVSSPSGLTVLEIAAGDKHVIALMSNKTVAVLGTNSSGQLGTGAVGSVLTTLTSLPLSDVEHVTAGAETSIMLHTDGTITVFGKNTRGELGLGNKANQLVPVKVTTVANVSKVVANLLTTVLLMKDGTIRASGFHDYIAGAVYNSNTSFVTLPGLSGVQDVFAGGKSQFVKLLGQPAGVLRGWGGNNVGELGDGTITERHTPSYAYFTQVPAYVAPVVTPVVSTPVTSTTAPSFQNSSPFAPVYDSMWACLKANPLWKGKDCNAILAPHLRGKNNVGPWACVSVKNGGDPANKDKSAKCSKEEQGD